VTGGNTSCVELELEDGTTVILDAGTGLRELGIDFARRPPAQIHLCLTHLHVDHVLGLPFFAPFWMPNAEIHIWAALPPQSLEAAIERYVSPPLFPLNLKDTPAHVVLHELPQHEWALGSARVLAEPVMHRGPTVGYRFEENDRSLVYIPDHEPYLRMSPGSVDPTVLSGFRLAENASLLIHDDAQYFEEEYVAHTGWGHSSVAHAVRFAHTVRAERLVLFHHDPLHSDSDLAKLERRARELWNHGGPAPLLALEGMTLALDAAARNRAA
jgi:phosphoribosyl 1,2-cyclic phosphodiesterase